MNSAEPLVQFVRDALIAGKSRDDIRSALAASGWSPGEIDGALASFSEVTFSPPVPRPRLRLTARDAFVYLLLFSALGVSVGQLISLIFAILDFHLPDPADSRWVAGKALATIRWAVATLLVSVPAFVWLMLYTGQKIAQEAGHQRSLVRKWLTYLALFVSAIGLFGDAVYIFYGFLIGEITLRFVLKVIAVAFVAASIFVFFLSNLEDFKDVQ